MTGGGDRFGFCGQLLPAPIESLELGCRFPQIFLQARCVPGARLIGVRACQLSFELEDPLVALDQFLPQPFNLATQALVFTLQPLRL